MYSKGLLNGIFNTTFTSAFTPSTLDLFDPIIEHIGISFLHIFQPSGKFHTSVNFCIETLHPIVTSIPIGLDCILDFGGAIDLSVKEHKQQTRNVKSKYNIRID